MGYDEDIAENKGKIKKLEGKIEAAEAKYPADTRHPGVKEDIMRWSQDIKELEVKNEILEYKRVVPNFMTDAEAKAGL